MKKIILFFFIVSSVALLRAQSIGEMAPEKPLEIFPKNSLGLDIMFSEGGFGLGTFYRRQLEGDFTLFTDFSVSEAKDESEIEMYDYYGEPYTVGKKNRVFLLPLNLGLQYRLFKGELSENLRPYLNCGLGPTMVVTTPYSEEFFTSFKWAQARYAAGGYIGLGANFGLDKSALIGFNLRYYVIEFFDKGVESLEGKYNKRLGGIFITINIGTMY